MKLNIRSANFTTEVVGNLTTDAEKLAKIVEAGIQSIVEREALSKVFKGVKVRKSVAFSVDAAKVFSAKIKEALTPYLTDLSVPDASRRVFTAPSKDEAAQAAYDASKADPLFASLPAEMRETIALKAAQSHKADWKPGAVVAESITPVASEEAEEQPMEG